MVWFVFNRPSAQSSRSVDNLLTNPAAVLGLGLSVAGGDLSALGLNFKLPTPFSIPSTIAGKLLPKLPGVVLGVGKTVGRTFGNVGKFFGKFGNNFGKGFVNVGKKVGKGFVDAGKTVGNGIVDAGKTIGGEWHFFFVYHIQNIIFVKNIYTIQMKWQY